MVNESTNNIELNENIKLGKWLVCYYAEWCGYCKRMADDWEQFENKVLENKLDITVVKIEQKNITDNITGYPTIIYYDNGKPEKYIGERTTEDLYAFVKSKMMCDKCGKPKN